MPRRKVEVFSLSFLDVICCGFGAVILFYTIISAQSGVERTRKAEDLSAQVAKLEEEVIAGARNLVLLRNTLKTTESETVSASSRATQLIEELQRKREESFIYDAETLAKRERIEKLKADVKALEENARRLEASAKVATPRSELTGAGKSVVSRRYITGLTLKGRRILLLLDRSSSMLDEDLVNIIRLRNSPPAAQLSAQKWRRATDIATWIIGEIPQGSQYQVYGFNTAAAPVLEGTAGEQPPIVHARIGHRQRHVPPHVARGTGLRLTAHGHGFTIDHRAQGHLLRKAIVGSPQAEGHLVAHIGVYRGNVDRRTVVVDAFQTHPLTDPAVRPLTMNFCKAMNKMTTGTAASRAPAANGPQFSAYC